MYYTRTYWVLNPYLKSLHLTVDYWELHHNKWVWRMKGRELLVAVSEVGLRGLEYREDPEFLKDVPRLEIYVLALEWLAEGYQPVNILLRVPHIKTSWYLMGYYNKEGFRISIYAKVEMSKSGSWRSVDREDLYN